MREGGGLWSLPTICMLEDITWQIVWGVRGVLDVLEGPPVLFIQLFHFQGHPIHIHLLICVLYDERHSLHNGTCSFPSVCIPK